MTRDTTLTGGSLPTLAALDWLVITRDLCQRHLDHARRRAAESPIGSRSPWPEMVEQYETLITELDTRIASAGERVRV
jgi:hypothetical protein